MGHSSKTTKRDNQKSTQDRELGVCIFCDLLVYYNQEKFNLGIDQPIRIDLITHKVCYKKYRDSGDLGLFLNDNLPEYIEKYEEVDYGKAKKAYHTKQH